MNEVLIIAKPFSVLDLSDLIVKKMFIYTHTLTTAVIVCFRDMYPQGVAVSEFFVPHDFAPMFRHCSMPHQSSFGRTSCSMLQQRMLQKGQFLSCERLGSVRP